MLRVVIPLLGNERCRPLIRNSLLKIDEQFY